MPSRISIHILRMWKGNWLWLSVAGILSRNQKLDLHAVCCIAEILAGRERTHVAQSIELLVNHVQILARHEHINIFRESTKAVMEHGHAANDDERNSELI